MPRYLIAITTVIGLQKLEEVTLENESKVLRFKERHLLLEQELAKEENGESPEDFESGETKDYEEAIDSEETNVIFENGAMPDAPAEETAVTEPETEA